LSVFSKTIEHKTRQFSNIEWTSFAFFSPYLLIDCNYSCENYYQSDELIAASIVSENVLLKWFLGNNIADPWFSL